MYITPNYTIASPDYGPEWTMITVIGNIRCCVLGQAHFRGMLIFSELVDSKLMTNKTCTKHQPDALACMQIGQLFTIILVLGEHNLHQTKASVYSIYLSKLIEFKCVYINISL